MKTVDLFIVHITLAAAALAQGNPTVTNIGGVFNHDSYQNGGGGLLTEVIGVVQVDILRDLVSLIPDVPQKG